MEETKEKIAILKNEFDLLANEYVKIFCEKQDMYFDFWVGDEIGGVASVGDYFFNLDDIRYDIDSKIKKGEILDWQDYVIETDSRVEDRT